MVATDKLIGRVSTWASVAVFVSLLVVPFLPGSVSEAPKQPEPSHSAKAPAENSRAARTAAKKSVAAEPEVAKRADPKDRDAVIVPPLAAATPDTRGPIPKSKLNEAPAAATSEPARDAEVPAERSSSDAKSAQKDAAPASAASVPAEAPPPPDEWTPAEVADGLRACLKMLGPVTAEVAIEDPVKKGQCGTAAPIRLESLGDANKVVFDPAPQMNCRLAAGLARWVDAVLQPAAREVLGSRITRIVGSYAYSCRHMYSNPKLPLSEHALGNAIDIAGFVTADGRTIRVAKGWGPTERDIAKAKEQARKAAAKKAAAKAKAKSKQNEAAKDAAKDEKSKPEKASVQKANLKNDEDDAEAPVPAAGTLTAAKTAESAFLKRLHSGACTVFGTVLGPEANEAHRDHFHLDMKKRRHSAVCH